MSILLERTHNFAHICCQIDIKNGMRISQFIYNLQSCVSLTNYFLQIDHIDSPFLDVLVPNVVLLVFPIQLNEQKAKCMLSFTLIIITVSNNATFTKNNDNADDTVINLVDGISIKCMMIVMHDAKQISSLTKKNSRILTSNIVHAILSIFVLFSLVVVSF